MQIIVQRCFKCLQTLPLDDFYPHKQMANGHLGKCKVCTKRDVAEHRDSHREQISAYEKRRFQEPERRANMAAAAKTHRERYPDRYKARTAVNNAVRDGRLIRTLCCVCGGNDRVQAHHHDYSKPLDVEWLCFKCHREERHDQIVIDSKHRAAA